MAERIETPRGRGLTVEHLTASLAQIETWCRAVREALDSIPDKDAVRFPDTFGGTALEAQVNPKQKAGQCPPPDPDDDDRVLEAQVHPKQKAGQCPPPDPDDDDYATH